MLQIHLSVHKPLDMLILMSYHDHITGGLLAMQHYTTYFEVPFIHKETHIILRVYLMILKLFDNEQWKLNDVLNLEHQVTAQFVGER